MGRTRLRTCLRLFIAATAVAAVAAPLGARAVAEPVAALDAPTAVKAAPAGPTTSAAAAPFCGPRLKKRGGGFWRCSFSDDFAGTVLDGSKWVVQTTAFSGYTTGGADCYVDSPRNVYVSNGALNLVAQKEPEPFTCESPGEDFTSNHTAATVLTWQRFSQAYGRFEFRAKFPATRVPGLHSALWLYPQQLPYGAWPNSGEIDVAEHYTGIPDKVYPSLHYNGRTEADTGWNCPVAQPSRYHTYRVEWAPRRMHFYYDGKLCYQRSWTPAGDLLAPKPFDIPYYLVLTQAVGGLWNSPTAATPFPGRTQVDWVRVWR